MAEYWVDPENGSDGAAGTEAAPWLLIPGQAGANTVSAGDTINVRNGTTTTARITVPANNLTYRGYWLADNVLMLTLPGAYNPTTTRTLRVVREDGVHEGMWSLNAAGNDADGMINFGSRSGCVLEDVHVHGSDVAGRVLVKIGTTLQTGVGATLRRCSLVGSLGGGLASSRPDLLFEDSLVKDIADDGIMITSDLAQSFHAGTFVKLRRLHIVNPGSDYGGATGDAVQIAAPISYQGKFEFTDSVVEKPSLVKQGLMVARIEGHVLHARCLWVGAGNIQVGINGILAGGSVTVDSVVWRQDGSNLNPYVRFVDVGGLGAGSKVTVKNSIVDVPGVHGGLFNVGSSSAPISGTIEIDGNTVAGAAATGLTTSAQVSFGSSTTLFDATAQAYCRNNAFNGESTVVFRIPAGVANNSKYVFANNRAEGALAYAYQGAQGGGTSYATVAAFEAAHSAADGNTEGDLMLSPSYRPLPGSPLIGAGTHLGYTRDLNGVQRQNPPTPGAYEAMTPRGAASAREARNG